MKQIALAWSNVGYSVRSGFWLKKKAILTDISLEVPQGSALGLIGPNGAGKTTTLKLGAGLLQPDAGEVSILGQPSSKATVKQSLGLLTEAQYVYPHLKLREWLDLLAALSGLAKSDRKNQVGKVLALFGLEQQADQTMVSLSKGQTQRAGLAQCFVHDPETLLLDEPMSGLDPYWRHRVLQILQEYQDMGCTMVFSSHILADVEHLTERIALLQNGRIQWSGTISELPRKVNGYEVICRAESQDALKEYTHNGQLYQEATGAFRLTISKEMKELFIDQAVQKDIRIESLRPIQQEVEEILFNFSLQ